MFHCERRSLDLSVESCVNDFYRVERRGTYPWRSDWHCKGCEQGSLHAGRAVVTVQAATADSDVVMAARHICARCHRASERFIGNRLCRSCDARDRELLKGRNGKGVFPRLLAARLNLHPVSVRFVENNSVKQEVVERSSGMLEAIITVVRREKKNLEFSRAIPVEGIRQLSFWGGC